MVKKTKKYKNQKSPASNAKLFIGLTTKPFGTFVPKQHNYFKYFKRAKKPFFYERLPLYWRSGRDSNPRPHA